MQVQRKNSILTSSLDAGSKDVTPIVVAMLWSNHCNHLQPIYQLPDRRMRARGCVVPAYTHKQLSMQIKEAGKKAPTAVRTALREEHSVQHIVSSVHHATVHA